MKMKHLEYIRMILLLSNIASTALVKCDNRLFMELNEILSNSNISLEDIRYYSVLGYDLSFLVGSKLEQLTKEYEKVYYLYNGVICNTAELIEAFGIQDNPIKVFALFIYLYRSGYLSNNKHFMYSTNMKDFPLLNGVDVVRGTGVCRSISSMFTDVAREVGLTASNVCVRVTDKALGKKEGMSIVPLEVEDKGRKFAKIVGRMTSVLPIGNHLVTAISSDKYSGIYDPTNDVFMNMRSFGKYEFINNTGATMSYNIVSNVVPKLFGQMDTNIDIGGLIKNAKKNNVSYEEYCEVYREILELIKDKQEIFDEFYQINLPYYERIDKIMEDQHGMIKRMIPIIPSGRRK